MRLASSTDISPPAQGVDHRHVQKELGEVIVRLHNPVVLSPTTIQVTWTVREHSLIIKSLTFSSISAFLRAAATVSLSHRVKISDKKATKVAPANSLRLNINFLCQHLSSLFLPECRDAFEIL